MTSALLYLAVFVGWIGVGPFLSRFMSRRGHDALAWLSVGSLLGPFALAVALMERLSGAGREPDIVVWGSPGDGHVHLLLSLDFGDDVVGAAQPLIQKFDGHLGRVSLVRVLPKGGPVADEDRARITLVREAERMEDVGAEAVLHYGLTATTLAAAAVDGGYQIVLTEDRDEDLAARLRTNGIRYVAGYGEAHRMVTRECLAFPDTRTARSGTGSVRLARY